VIAITREVSAGFAACELSFVARSPIDVARARMQHRAYEDALRALGCVVESMVQQPGLADSVFVEDTAIVFDELAVMTRPGAAVAARGSRIGGRSAGTASTAALDAGARHPRRR
jgi:dimethylargininase